MSDGKLVFIRSADGTGRLVFNDESVATVPDVSIGIDATFAGETADMPAAVQMLWDAGVSRGERHTAPIAWQDAQCVGARAQQVWQDAQRFLHQAATHWQDASAIGARAAQQWAEAQRLRAQATARWQDGDAQRHSARQEWQEAQRLRALAAARWQDGAAMRHTTRNDWQEAIRLRHLAAQRWQDGSAMRREMRHSNGPGIPVRIQAATRWQDAMRPPAGLSTVVQPPVTPPEPCYDPATLGRLEFTEPWAVGDGRLVFVCVRGGVGPEFPPATLIILPARYYMAVHSLTAARLPDNEAVAIFDVSLSADKGSFDWSFSARARRDAIEQFEPVAGVRPAIKITLDGLDFVFTVDKIAESEAFGQRGVTISGRSVTALIGGQHARETSRLNASAATAQQLALAALEFSGVGLDWGIPDWLVPAGAWSHTGTPLAAVQNIVEAAGGYLQSHRTLPTLLARHPYPDLPGGMVGAPWHWESASFAADVALAPDALMVTGTEHVDGAEINAVYVSGVSQGVRALYRRSGTAGDLLAPMVSDPLIVAPEVARMRGRSIVGAAGRKHLVSIELPVLTGPSQPGVLDVGQLVQIDAAAPWRGMVRSVRASAKFGEKVRQTVQIERHLEQV